MANKFTTVSSWAGHALSAQHYGTSSGVHYPLMRENLLPAASVKPPIRRAGMPPLHDVSSAWKKDIAASATICWPTRRDEIGAKPTRPWTHTTGFFYAERLNDAKVDLAGPSPSPSRVSLLDEPRTPPAKTVAPLRPAGRVVLNLMVPPPAHASHSAGVIPMGSTQHARWLTPRYLNLPTTNEPNLLRLPQPWGPKVHSAADGIAKRWPEVVG